LTQFDGVDFRKTTIPFVDSSEAVDRAISQINACREADGKRPIVISSIVNEHLSERMRDSDAFVLDFFQIFISPLEQELGVKRLARGRTFARAAQSGRIFHPYRSDQLRAGARRRSEHQGA
jgi:regulator of PEP synthase PpsR (kinase-PPPase family)